MNDDYIISIYKKEDITEDIIVFKKEETIRSAFIDFDDDVDSAIYYDEDGRRISVESMDSEYSFVSDEKYCYGFPITMDYLRKRYKECKTDDELIEKYNDEICMVIMFGYYNAKEDNYKIYTSNVKQLESIDFNEDELFTSYGITYDDEKAKAVTISVSDLSSLIKMLNNKEYDKLKKKLISFKDEAFENEFDIFDDEELEELLKEAHEAKKEEIKKEEIKKTDLNTSIQKLNDMVGLDNVKREINKLLYYSMFLKKVKDKVHLEKPKLSMFFSGNPGTGKTTVARLIGEIMNNMGYLSSSSFTEITAKDLIGEYVGQTAPKTANIIKKNKGGVIFIDEAYVLASHAQEYSSEALAEILKELEKNETIFIFAGYKDEMEQFMNLNPGLTSRIGYYMKFEDYSLDQLYEMFKNKVEKIGFNIDKQLELKVKETIKKAMNEKHFGNGRFVDKLIEKIITEHAKNTKDITSTEELLTLSQNDINQDLEEALTYQRTKKKNFGF